MCWTPYFVISAWWWFDRESASKLDTKVQRGLFIFAVSNSCMDPIVYGIFAINFVREFKRCCCFRRRQIPQSQTSRRVASVARDPRNGCLKAEERELSSGRVPSRTASGSSQERSHSFMPHRTPLLNEGTADECAGTEGSPAGLTRKATPPHIAGTYRTTEKEYARL